MPNLSRTGVGNVLLWHTLRDSAQRGDSIYDMGPGSLESKRHFLTRSNADLPPQLFSQHGFANADLATPPLVGRAAVGQEVIFRFGNNGDGGS